jgi:hypothetical protein
MAVPKTKEECDKKGWFWNAETEICEKPVIVDIKMTLTRGSGCDDDEHKTVVPKPHKLAKSVRDTLLDASRAKGRK